MSGIGSGEWYRLLSLLMIFWITLRMVLHLFSHDFAFDKPCFWILFALILYLKAMFIDILVDLFFSYRLLKEGIEDVVDLASYTAEYFGLVIKQPKLQESETSKTRTLMYNFISALAQIVVHLGDNCIQNFHLGRYIIGYTVGNLVLWRRVSEAIKRDFLTYIRQYTSSNENFEYGYPHSNALLTFSFKKTVKMYLLRLYVKRLPAA